MGKVEEAMKADEARSIVNRLQQRDCSAEILESVRLAAACGERSVEVDGWRMTSATRRRLVELGYHVYAKRFCLQWGQRKKENLYVVSW
jgi:hypothetical protein